MSNTDVDGTIMLRADRVADSDVLSRGRALGRLVQQAIAFVALVVMASFSSTVAAEDPGQTGRCSVGEFRDSVLKDADGEHRYVVFLPPGYEPTRKWPVILSLHGAGERGRDGRRQLTVGLGPIVQLHPEAFPAVIVFPQVEETDERILTAWSPENPDGRRALSILADVERTYSVDSQKRILAGWSMGGYGVWQIAAASEPGFWSAAITVSGGAPPEVAAHIPPKLPLWAIHGSTDRIVRPSQMVQAVEAAKSAGSSVTTTTIGGQGHNVWRVVFGREEVRKWMFDPTSLDPVQLRWSKDDIARLEEQNILPELPFQPAAQVSRAIAVRIGNEAFAEFARGVPEAIAPERLRGEAADIKRTIIYGGATLNAAIRNIQWTTELAEVEIVAAAAERLVVRVALRNLTLHSTGGDLRGGGYEADCGPFDVVMGRRRPVWVEVTLRPRVQHGTIHLTREHIAFSIPDDNWLVTEPAWATAKGTGLTPDLVKVGFVGGMYRAKDSVEAAVRELVAPLIERIEQRLAIVPPDSLASLLWPLPTSPPRVRLVPEGIRTDRAGISVTVGLLVEGPGDSRDLTHFHTRGPIREGRFDGLSIGIAPSVLSSVAAVFAQDDSARLDVRDSPESALAALGSESLLRGVAPGMLTVNDDFEMRTVISTPQPFRIGLEGDDGSGSSQALTMKLHAPEVLLEVSRRPRDRSRGWQRCVECRVSLTQDIQITLNGSGSTGRDVALTWKGSPVITGQAKFAPAFSPADRTLDGPRMIEAFTDAWGKWTTSEESTSRVEDLAVGGARLRLHAIPKRGERVWLEFEPAPAAVRQAASKAPVD